MSARSAAGAMLFSVVASCSAAAQSTSPAPATVLTSAQLRGVADSLPTASLASVPLGRGSGYNYAFNHRDLTGAIEVHMEWTDIFVIQSGSATLLTGGSLAGAKESSAGEWRDGRLTGGTATKVKPGDVVIIPATTPHQFRLEPGEQVNYLTFKIAASPRD
jgi:Mannose-6-phosphate isomerase